MNQPIILTGLRANNDLTLGNYFGGMLPIINMAKTKADKYQINMFIPDLHSFTTPIDHNVLYIQAINNAKLFAAAGLPLDYENIHLYRQSFIPAHSELTWILDCFTGFGQMSRMTQFKDKSAKESDVSLGLFNYPVLMAADILLYGAQYVPVGDDQTQHLEFTRDIAERMNAKFGELFVVPEAIKKQRKFFGRSKSLRVKDLQNPTKKMSKSDESGKGVIFLNDTPEVATKKVMAAETDDLANVQYEPIRQPGISNLIEILALLRGSSIEAVAVEFQNESRYGEFKAVVARELSQFLANFQDALAEVNDSNVLQKLEASEHLMNQQANQTLGRIQQAIGLRLKAT